MTTYSNRSNATRAAKKAGLEKFSIIEVDGKFRIEESKPVPVAAPAPKKTVRKAPPVRSRSKPSPAVGANAKIIALITKGATISELMNALGWQAHSVRGSISRLGTAGYKVERTKVGSADEGFESHYKIAS